MPRGGELSKERKPKKGYWRGAKYEMFGPRMMVVERMI